MTISDTAPVRVTIRTTTHGEVYAAGRMTKTRTATPAVTMLVSGDSGPTRQLSSLDVQLLDNETPATPMSIGGVVMLQPEDAPLTLGALRRLFASRLHMIAPLRWRLRTVPLGLDLPYWDDSASIDLGFHVRETMFPDGASDQDLADLVARLHSSPLDRDRPLWECHLVTGLSGGRQALYMKVHHALIDGLSAAEIMAAICDIVPDATPLPAPVRGVRLNRTPELPEMLARSAVNGIERQRNRIRALASSGPALLRTLPELFKKHPDVPFNRTNTAGRSLAFASVPLADVKLVKQSVGGTVNDVVMTLCTAALRRWLLAHDLPADRSLVAAVPVSVRTPEQLGTAGNQFSIMFCDLPVDESEPRRRLNRLHDGLIEAKERFQTAPSTMMHEATGMLTPLLNGAPTRVALRAAAAVLPFANTIVSNVPGPQIPLYVAGIRVTASYPVSLLTDLSGGLNITVMSYDGHLDFGILACADSIPDVGTIGEYLVEALEELLAGIRA
ncbi:WS/DGAT/MGAT family O-acyltransferase [Nocardia jejuensis]|uniref:WS/DGAT/MGAT family O-acyltransferase n=1 Tax=Nocardia jejuensis TaxID=328049 RepID=UPI000A02E81F|nr:wax ester/triacylglycerol synthase family O-acyltransferase [Nocardia jejuensis]